MSSITREEAKGCVGIGWSLLLDKLYDAKPRAVYVLQVKEKFGGLRFYIGTAPLEYHNLITKIEKESYKICEDCGRKGKSVNINGWTKTLCNTCFKNSGSR